MICGSSEAEKQKYNLKKITEYNFISDKSNYEMFNEEEEFKLTKEAMTQIGLSVNFFFFFFFFFYNFFIYIFFFYLLI